MDGIRWHLAQRTTGIALATAAVATLLVAAASLVLAAAAPASLARSAFGAERPQGPLPDARVSVVSDVMHIKQVQAYLSGFAPPISPPLVYYFGDSTSRESVVSEDRWRDKILALGGPELQPYVLASRNQTFPLDRVIADGLPDEPALVLISVALSRFTNPPASDPDLGEPLGSTPTLSPWRQHLYSTADMLTVAQKRAKMQHWLAKRYPVFKKNEASEVARLKALVGVCQQRGWRVALVEMPVNKAIVGHRFDAPIARYRADCAALAHDAGIPFLRFTGIVSGGNRNFYDIIHLVGDGRVKWQARLAAEVIKLLAPPQ
jgi:hypothetical protein